MARKKKGKKTSTTRRRRLKRADPPDLNTTLASIIGGGGGALLGGVAANRGWDPAMVALAMTVGGGVGAYTLDGNLRVAANGLAAAGAGQLALALLAKSAEPKEEDSTAKKPAKKNSASAQPQPANAGGLPAGSIESAFERARHRLAVEDDDRDRYFDVIDVDMAEAA
jgi:hypothetical protein